MELKAVAAALFCPIHSSISMLQKAIDILIIVGIQRNPDADSNGDLM